MASDIKSTKDPLPWWGKVLVGLLGGFVIIKYTPILEIMTMFFYIVIVPIVFLTSLVSLGAGTLEVTMGAWKRTVDEINARVNDKVKSKAA